MKQPKIIKRTFTLDANQGGVLFALNMDPPKGYTFLSMDRKLTKMIISYIKNK